MNKYKEKLDEIEFSFSTLHLYEQCPYAFYLKKICGDIGENNAYAEIGSAGHHWNEQIFKKIMTVEEALIDCAENFDDWVLEDISESSKEKKYEALCDYFTAFDDFYKERYEVVGVEQEFNWKIGKYKCVGYADLILKDKQSGNVLLVDHKSANHFFKKDGTVLKNQQENFEAYRKQMYMYADAMKKKYGFYPDYMVWNHFLDGGATTVIPFDMAEHAAAIKWVKDTIRSIYKDTTFEAGKRDYTRCNIICNYRNDCEYKEFGMDDE